MALDFLEEIYSDSVVLFNIKLMSKYLYGGKYKLFLDLWNSQLENMVSFCKNTVNYDEQLGAYIWNNLSEIRELIKNRLFVQVADKLDELLPFIYKAIELRGAIDVDDDNYKLFSSKSGFLSLKDLSKNDYALSRIDPMWEAFEKAQALYDPQMQSLCSIGCNLGYLQLQLFNKYNGILDIYIYENDEKWIRYAYDYGVLAWLPEDKIHILIYDDAESLVNAVIDNHEKMKEYTLISMEDRIYDFLSGNAKILGESISQSITTKSTFFEMTEQNFNSNYFHVKNQIEDLKKEIRGDEWIVVGGGPSVDDNIDYLKNNCGKKNIIAATTIFKRLLNEGIVPSYIVVSDMQNRTYGHLDGVENQDVPLIMTDCANWQFGKKYKGKKYLIPTSGMSFSEKLYKATNVKTWSVCGTVTATCIQVAIEMGAKTIELIGIDLAFPNNSSHAQGTMDYKKYENASFIEVKSVDGGMVNTDYIMRSYLFEIEKIIKMNSKITFRNLSKHGAYISGCK